MESDQLNAVGRVLIHGYVLCGYLPYLFNASIMYWILVGHELLMRERDNSSKLHYQQMILRMT